MQTSSFAICNFIILKIACYNMKYLIIYNDLIPYEKKYLL